MRQRLWSFFFILILGTAMLGGYFCLEGPGEAILREAVLAVGIAQTGAQNLVAAVYLDYRLFDTLLEALLLLVAVIGISQFSRRTPLEQAYPEVTPRAKSAHGPSQVILGSLGGIYLLIAVLGIYIILTGMDSPGGGFQGGAVLAAIVICTHFAEGRRVIAIPAAEQLEKAAYVLVLAVGILYLAYRSDLGTEMKRAYLTLMNLLIGAEVFSGLSLVYLRFMAVEGEEEG